VQDRDGGEDGAKTKMSKEDKKRERDEARALLEERSRRAQIPDSVLDPRERCGLLYGVCVCVFCVCVRMFFCMSVCVYV
jgi:hypothetical protein